MISRHGLGKFKVFQDGKGNVMLAKSKALLENLKTGPEGYGSIKAVAGKGFRRKVKIIKTTAGKRLYEWRENGEEKISSERPLFFDSDDDIDDESHQSKMKNDKFYNLSRPKKRHRMGKRNASLVCTFASDIVC